MSYAKLTVEDPNVLKRWIQKRRYRDAIKIIHKWPMNTPATILDFGCGNGELIRCLVPYFPTRVWGYDPVPVYLEQARQKLKDHSQVELIGHLANLEPDSFDYIFCLEVLEHLPPKELADSLSVIHTLLKPEGIAVIGVPHEIHVMALLKGMFRFSRRPGEFDGNLKNIWSATLGVTDMDRPIKQISEGGQYHPYHLGFNYRRLEEELDKNFVVQKKIFSPFNVLGDFLNSEVYFILKKKCPEMNHDGQ